MINWNVFKWVWRSPVATSAPLFTFTCHLFWFYLHGVFKSRTIASMDPAREFFFTSRISSLAQLYAAAATLWKLFYQSWKPETVSDIGAKTPQAHQQIFFFFFSEARIRDARLVSPRPPWLPPQTLKASSPHAGGHFFARQCLKSLPPPPPPWMGKADPFQSIAGTCPSQSFFLFCFFWTHFIATEWFSGTNADFVSGWPLKRIPPRASRRSHGSIH